LLELAKQLGNVSQACKMMGYSRDSFYGGTHTGRRVKFCLKIPPKTNPLKQARQNFPVSHASCHESAVEIAP